MIACQPREWSQAFRCLALAGAALVAAGSGDLGGPAGAAPWLTYSTYLGGPGADEAFAMAVDSLGNVYLTGVTGAANFAALAAGTQTVGPGGRTDVFLAKLAPSGALMYLTYLGGAGDEEGRAIQVDASGNVWLAGRTNSADFPVTPGAFQRAHLGRWDAFLARLDRTGTALTYSTFLGGGGDDEAYGLALSSSEEALVTGRTTSGSDFPTTYGAWQRTYAGATDGFVSRFSRAGALLYSTFLGGWQYDTVNDIALDSQGSAVVTGWTQSVDFPVKDALQPVLGSPSAYRSEDGTGRWAAVTFPAKLFVRVWAFDPVNPSVVYAGTTAGFFKSVDRGATWTAANAGLTSFDVQGLAVDGKNPAILYAGTSAGGVFKTVDAGGRWSAVNAGLGNANVRWLAIDPGDSNVVYAATAGGVYKSTDAARSWRASSQGIGTIGLNVVVIDPKTPATLYAGSGSQGLFKSTDGGSSWVKSSEGLRGGNVSSIVIDPVNPSTLYLANWTDGAFKSTDGGKSWSQFGTGIPSGFHAYYLAIDPSDPAVVYASVSSGVFRSADSGQTWQRAESGLAGTGGPRLLAAHPADRALLLLACLPSSDAFVTKLNAAGTALVWSTFLGGEARDEARGVALDPAGNTYAAGMTSSSAFPTTPNAFQGAFGGDPDVFVVKLNPAGSLHLYSTYLGGRSSEEGLDVAARPTGEAVVVGWSRGELPVSPDALQRTVRGGRDAFLAVVDPGGAQIQHCSYLGGRADDWASAVALDSLGSVYLAGRVLSDNFPIASAAQVAYAGSNDAFVTRLGDVLAAAELVLVTPEALPAAAAGSSYLETLAALGGRPPYFWSVDSGALPPGLTLEPATGILSGTPTTPGGYRFTVRVTDGAQTYASRNLALTVTAPPRLTITSGTPLPAGGVGTAYSFTLTAAGGTAPYTWELAGGSLPPGLGLNGSTGQIGGTPTTVGNYPFKVRVTDQAGGIHTKDFALVITPPVSISAVVNGASWQAGAVAPGEIVTLTGTGLGPATLVSFHIVDGQFTNTLAETQVLFDNIPAPLIYVHDRQASAIVPYAVAGTGETRVEVQYRGARSSAVRAPVAGSAPGIFTADSTGRGPGAILNQDYTVNAAGNPAVRGSVVLIYATGEGETDPQVADGRLASAEELPRPRLPVEVKIGGAEAEVLYAGAAPGLVVGLLQVNVRVPEGAPSGNAVPVMLTVGTASSQPGVTMAVR